MHNSMTKDWQPIKFRSYYQISAFVKRHPIVLKLLLRLARVRISLYVLASGRGVLRPGALVFFLLPPDSREVVCALRS